MITEKISLLKILFDYFCEPIWVLYKDGDGVVRPVEYKEISNNFNLAKKIQKMNDLYQSTYSSDYPPDSKFKTEEEQKRFIKLYNEVLLEILAEAPDTLKIQLYYRPFSL